MTEVHFSLRRVCILLLKSGETLIGSGGGFGASTAAGGSIKAPELTARDDASALPELGIFFATNNSGPDLGDVETDDSSARFEMGGDITLRFTAPNSVTARPLLLEAVAVRR